jgi:hypothetical protein
VESAAWLCVGLYALSRLLEFARTPLADDTREETADA